jgi:hypothetical protein
MLEAILGLHGVSRLFMTFMAKVGRKANFTTETQGPQSWGKRKGDRSNLKGSVAPDRDELCDGSLGSAVYL